MKRYRKTFRASKVHKAKDCGLCAESANPNCASVRQEAKKHISENLVIEDVAQAEHDENEDWHEFSYNYDYYM